MVKNNALATAVLHTTPHCEEADASIPTPGHTDDEASDEEGGQTQHVSDNENMDTTMESQSSACPATRQDDVAGILLRGSVPPCWLDEHLLLLHHMLGKQPLKKRASCVRCLDRTGIWAT